jgi:Fe2+ transport system protein B
MAEHNAAGAEYETRRRFRAFLNMFRVSGVPILFNKVPTFFNLYSAVAVFCCYITTAAIVMDLLMNTEDLDHIMETARYLFPAVMIVWIHAFIR